MEPSHVRSENEVSKLPFRTSCFEILKNMENNQATTVTHLPIDATFLSSDCAGQKQGENLYYFQTIGTARAYPDSARRTRLDQR